MRAQRRVFLRRLAAAAGVAALPLAPTLALAAPRVAVVGGGFGGVAAALELRRLLPKAKITVIDPSPVYAAPPFFNFVAMGWWGMSQVLRRRQTLAAAGIDFAQGRALRLGGGFVHLQGGARLPYNRAILAPGIAFNWEAMPGVSAATAAAAPHAWRGREQTAALARQIAAMPPAGVFVVIPPAGAARCPPAPYERASLVAAAMQARQTRGKVLILDQKEGFPQQTLFEDGWHWHYRGRVEWRSAEAGGRVEALDLSRRRIQTEFGEEKADVISYIPPQRAAAVAAASGLAGADGWCAVNPQTMESLQMPGAHVAGDAANLLPLPKSAEAAAESGRVAAAAVARALGANVPAKTALNNLCFSYLTQDSAFVEEARYTATAAGLRAARFALTPRNVDEAERQRLAARGKTWHREILQKLFAPAGA